MMKTKTNTTFKKSVLGFFVVTAIAGSFIPWEDYMPRSETPAMKAFYENSDALQEDLVSQNMVNIDSDVLARIAEDHMVSDLDAEIDAQALQSAETFTTQDDGFEPGEVNDFNEVTLISEPLVEQQSDAVIMETPLLFSFDSSEISPEYFEALNETAEYMQNSDNESNTVWQVIGYADQSGNRVYNGKLANKRAQKVAAYLVDKGVAEEQLSVVSLGASTPLNSERSIENNRNERRVELHPYQAEITVLAEQYNKQMQQQASHQKALQLAKRQAEQEMQQYVEQLTKVTTKQDSAVESENNVEENVAETSEQPTKQTTETLEAEISERLTTAMEL
ncbi:hypothetical protein GCM10007916_11350 [Psychromonas marina]|uniref:OmpA-like domain-containing protein n=1 Tax=Psychromonas marina TaxID=88364 RepID=A0ABQ6DYK6_9GAMM|nr:OmpA family protein [Psychromonas marina]GLS90068.1 hypothetical protein GCM10007916_11350 [Psychromonas marina]